MPVATLLHNPKAGEKSFTAEELISEIENNKIRLHYSSLKEEGWDNISPDSDFIIVAGGDGTVRKVAMKMLKGAINRNFPIALLPAGTANNIAGTLKIPEEVEKAVQSWKEGLKKKFDAGIIHHPSSPGFFLESFGLGAFPALMTEMKEQNKDVLNSPEKKLKMAIDVLHRIVLSLEPFDCEIEMDDTFVSGKFLMVEIMNICSLGPNLQLSPQSDPGDGEFEVVLIPEGQREKLLAMVANKMRGEEDDEFFDVFKAKNIRIKCGQAIAHIDDEIVETGPEKDIRIGLVPGALEFLVSQTPR